MKYYICESGEAKSKADEYRANYERLRGDLFAFAARFGAKKVSLCDEMMLLNGIEIEGDVPAGWVTPRWLNGCARPKNIKANAELLKHFTPSGTYRVEHHPDLQAFFTWLNVPCYYEYEYDGGSGSSSIFHGFYGPQLVWFSATSPIAITLPDVAAIKAKALADGRRLTDGALDWMPPAGMRESSKEEWDYQVAKHRFETREARP